MVAPGRITRIERLEHRSASNVDAPGRLLVFRVVIDPNGSGRNETVEQQIVKEREHHLTDFAPQQTGSAAIHSRVRC